MKKSLLLLLLSIIIGCCYAQRGLPCCCHKGGESLVGTKDLKWYEIPNPLPPITNGMHQATIKCTDFGTYTITNSSSNVDVQNMVVTLIEFGNGLEVHKGYNSDGYDYIGGKLIMDVNNEEEFLFYTRITVNDNGNTKYFDVIIKP